MRRSFRLRTLFNPICSFSLSLLSLRFLICFLFAFCPSSPSLQLHGRELSDMKPTFFHSPGFATPQMTLYAYLERMANYNGCSGTCYVFALIIIDALMHRRGGGDPRFLIMPSSMHRLVLVAVVIAIKFLEDNFKSNRFYAKVGGIDVGEFNRIEKLLLFCIDFEVVSLTNHFARYANRLHYVLVMSHRALVRLPHLPPLWHISLPLFFVFAERRLVRTGRLSPEASTVAAAIRQSSNSPAAVRKSSNLRATTTSPPVVSRSRGLQRAASGLLPSMAAASPAAAPAPTPRRKTSDPATPAAAPRRKNSEPSRKLKSSEPRMPVASTTTSTSPKGQLSSDSVERTSTSPSSDIDSGVTKLKRVHSSELHSDLFGTRAAPPARRTSSEPAEIGQWRPRARSQLALISSASQRAIVSVDDLYLTRSGRMVARKEVSPRARSSSHSPRARRKKSSAPLHSAPTTSSSSSSSSSASASISTSSSSSTSKKAKRISPLSKVKQ
jgi:hypothetical protein